MTDFKAKMHQIRFR